MKSQSYFWQILLFTNKTQDTFVKTQFCLTFISTFSLAKNSQSSFHIYPGDFWRSSMSRRYWDNIYRSRWRYFWSGGTLHGFWHSKRTCLTYWNIFHMWILHYQSSLRIFSSPPVLKQFLKMHLLSPTRSPKILLVSTLPSHFIVCFIDSYFFLPHFYSIF